MYSVPLYTQEEGKIREEPEEGRERDVDRGGGDDGSDLLSNFGDALGDFASEISRRQPFELVRCQLEPYPQDRTEAARTLE